MYGDRIDWSKITGFEYRKLKKEEETKKYDSLYDFIAYTEDLAEVPTPIRLVYRGVEIRILEVYKAEMIDHVEYIVTLQFKYGDRVTHPFVIYCNDINDFVDKLRIELIRFKLYKRLIPDLYDMLTF